MNTSTSKIDTKILRGQSQTEVIIIGVSAVILLILSSVLTIIVIVLIRNYRRRSAKQELFNDSSYSTLNSNRGSELQVKPHFIQQNSNELYDQIHLSPSTGQTEFISKPQSESTNNPPFNSHPTHPHTENSVTSASATSQVNSPQATYAAIDKSKKKKVKNPAAEKFTQKVSSTKWAHNIEGKSNSTKKSLDDIYASDHKDREKVNSEQESNPPPSVEELYTVVKKKATGSSVPVNEPVSKAAEDLYTAVMKKPKENLNSVNNKAVPSIPPHTIEELYTAVHKMPKGNTMEDEEEAPPIPPHSVEGTF